MKRWFISDTHWNHENIIKFCRSHHFKDIYDMNETMIESWNKTVGDDDLIYHIGDICSPRTTDPSPIISRLKGNIILIKGNHDKKKLIRKMPSWTERMAIKLGNYKCLLNHKPGYPEWMRTERLDPFNDNDNNIDYNPWDFIISGHIHNNYCPDERGVPQGRLWTGKSLNLSVELHNYTPISENELIELLKKRAKTYFEPYNVKRHVIVTAAGKTYGKDSIKERGPILPNR